MTERQRQRKTRKAPPAVFAPKTVVRPTPAGCLSPYNPSALVLKSEVVWQVIKLISPLDHNDPARRLLTTFLRTVQTMKDVETVAKEQQEMARHMAEATA